MFGKYIPCRDAAITKLDAKDIMHDPSAYRLLACLPVRMYGRCRWLINIHSRTACLLAWLEVGCRDEAALLVMGAN